MLNRRENGTTDFFEILNGELYAGPYPGSTHRDEAVRKIEDLMDIGVTNFVDLTEVREKGRRGNLYPYAPLAEGVAASRGIDAPSHTRMSIPDLSVPSAGQMRETLELIEGSLAAGQTVYFHCWGGVGRTGTVLGCLLIEPGTPHDDVFHVIAQMRAGTARAIRQAPETEEQREFVLNWPAPGD